MADHETTTIEQDVEIPASPAKVYEALVTPAIHSAFTGAEAAGGTAVGDTFSAWDGYIDGKHLELVPGKKIVQEWTTSEWPEGYGPSRLEFTLEEVDGKTHLHMVHSEVPTEQAESYRTGWFESYWQPMTEYFEDHASKK